ncbi:hypothetical protein ACFOWE_15555 [Planomonospora corallina]|uniref:Uncharacterized protein n=1 Tax=Planomonospora corallina TaxID=1806052 RepID=A0ABV8I718_9ACTN
MDDIDKRFQELTAQIEAEERRKMAQAARQEWTRPPRNRRRRRRWVAAAVVLATVAGAGALVAFRPDLLDLPGLLDEARTTAAEHLPLAEASPGPAPAETEPVETEPVIASPFDGSPAADYADGVKGLVMPRARAVGGLGKQDVAKALDRAHALLKASNLDRRTLLKGDAKPFAKLLHPEERTWFLKNMDRRKKPKGRDFDTRSWLTSFAPETAVFATDVIKVHGRTKLSPFKEDGLSGARVTVNYLFVYAVHRPGQPHTTTRVIAHGRGELLAYRTGGELVLWVLEWNAGGVTGVRCDVDDRFVHPFYEDSVPDEEVAKATAAPIDPYDLDRDHDDVKGCRRAKRS